MPMSQYCDLIIENVQIASMQYNGMPYGAVPYSAVAVKDGLIFDIYNPTIKPYHAAKIVNGNNNWLLPGLIDCHTHLVFGGDRCEEFEQRLQGQSYADIAKQGGGIQSTVKATRAATKQQLLKSALKRASRLADEGVTCIEVKSGYGLDLHTEIKMLEVAQEIADHLPLTIVTTYLGAHALPLEYLTKPNEYIDFICDHVIPVIADRKLATSVDVFCESIGFNLAQCQQVFEAAKSHKLNIKAHAEQLSDSKGAKLAAKFGALSVDHIEYLAPCDVPAIKHADSVAVLLPGAFYCLNETQKPPVASLRENNIPIAIATDLNPGSSPIASLLTVMNMACVLFGLTPQEALFGVTVNAAKALGMTNKGCIDQGMDADLCLWEISHPSALSYGINQHRPIAKWIGGSMVPTNKHV
jgi:imidazolonepropionase